MYFSFDSGWYSTHFDIVHRGWGGGLLNGQNLLSVTKVICQQFLGVFTDFANFAGKQLC